MWHGDGEDGGVGGGVGMGGWGEANCDRDLPASESHGERSP